MPIPFIENEIEQANEEPDLKPNQFEKSSDLAMEDFNDEESSGGLILDDKGAVGGDKIEHQIEQQLEEELASTTTEFDTTTIPRKAF